MKIIKKKKYSKERELYNTKNAILSNCVFEGAEDGESPLKESTNIKLDNCSFSLRYALWHCTHVEINKTKFNDTCRAPFWYCKDIKLDRCILNGVKAFRESKNITIKNSEIISPEFAWMCNNINFYKLILTSEYALFNSKNISMEDVKFNGKYSFQYIKNSAIENCVFNTKDAFWHAKNVTVKNSVIDGEYLGWYSDGLTFINCKIKGTQPLCYCNNLKLINCEMIDCDLAFEYSDVQADLIGHIKSIKNPTSGKILYESCDEVILKDSKKPLNCLIISK